MTYNDYIRCNICGHLIRLRIQMGYFDVPFTIECPNCQSIISGFVQIDPYIVTLENAHTTKKTEASGDTVELSAEFPTKKITPGIDGLIEATPFIRNLQFYKSNKEAYELTQQAMSFASNIKSGHWAEIQQDYNLFWNNQDKILNDKLQREISNYPIVQIKRIKNKYDAMMGLHQLMLTTTGLSNVIGQELKDYTEISALLLSSKKRYDEIYKYAQKYIDFNDFEKKAFSLLAQFAKIYDQLVPVVALQRGGVLNEIDKSKYGIMTANFKELSNFYANSYEWILDKIQIVLALNNIYERGVFNKCVNDKDYTQFIKLSKGNRLQQDFISQEEPFSQPLKSLNNKIRNSIQHFDSSINYTSQEITFKDRQKSESLYLIDFAALCVNNASLVIYLLEIVYNLRKISMIKEGVFPTFLNKGKRHKIGRNAPCPCGSGKKYKKCCLGKGIYEF